MLGAMLRSGSQNSALLVLACRMEELSPALSPAQVAERLNLCTLTYPWQVGVLDLLFDILYNYSICRSN